MCRALKPNQEAIELRQSLGKFPTGVAIVTAMSESGNPIGMTINSFHSISLNPALIGWCMDRKSKSYQDFAQCKEFTITVLADNQHEAARFFATAGANKFQGIECDNPAGPIIPGGCAWYRCHNYQQVILGDHLLMVGQVSCHDRDIKPPLLFSEGSFQCMRWAQSAEEITNTNIQQRSAA